MILHMAPSATKHIPVVDDEPVVRGEVVAYLEREGFHVEEAATGNEALNRINDSRPDLVVLDVMLPELDGFSVLTELSRGGDVPVILLTGCDDVETRAAGMKLGVSEFLCKPFAHHELIERINNQLEVRRISRELDTIAEQL